MGRGLTARRIENERENFRNLFRQTPEMVVILSGPEHRFEFVNEAHVEVLGFDATGMTVRQAQPESVEIHCILDEVYRTGKTAELHEIPITVTNRLRYFNLTYAARRDDYGKINGIMVMGIEVTDQVLSRRAIENSQARFGELANSMPQIIYVSAPDGTTTFLNERWFQYTGGASDDLASVFTSDYIHPEDGVRVREAFDAAAAAGAVFEAELRLRRADGEYRWFITRAVPRFENGALREWYGTSTDIHDHKVVAEELERSRERYRLFFNSSPLPKFIYDPETFQFLDVNEAFLNVYGYRREDIRSIDARSIRPLEEVSRFVSDSASYFDLSAPRHHGVFRHMKKNGTPFFVDVTSHDLMLNGRRARLTQIMDVTDKLASERRQAELLESLQSAKEEAERANELKSAFLANMSHEIRTPLGAMIGFADLLRDPGLSAAEHASYVDILIRNGQQLSLIIEDVLDISKIEAGHLTLEITQADPESIAADVISLLSVKAKDKEIALDLRIDPSTPKTIGTDAVRVRQVLLNLVGNAIKFTQVGSVRLTVKGCKTASGSEGVCFEVEDTGIGIPQDQSERIFEMFVQADGSMTRKFGGTGLGLALSKKLARSLGGDVSVVSTELGRGTIFRAFFEDLPAERRAETPTRFLERDPDIAEDALDGVSVLVVDDSPDNQRIIWHFLKKRGASVETADNGFEGFRKAIHGKFDIVLMDIQMPEMDGYTATQKLRDAGFRRPIIALTAHAMTEVRSKCMNVGCTDYLPKPINPKNLIAAVARHTI